MSKFWIRWEKRELLEESDKEKTSSDLDTQWDTALFIDILKAEGEKSRMTWWLYYFNSK